MRVGAEDAWMMRRDDAMASRYRGWRQREEEEEWTRTRATWCELEALAHGALTRASERNQASRYTSDQSKREIARER